MSMAWGHRPSGRECQYIADDGPQYCTGVVCTKDLMAGFQRHSRKGWTFPLESLKEQCSPFFSQNMERQNSAASQQHKAKQL